MPDLRIQLYVKDAPYQRWRSFIKELDRLLERTLKVAASDTARAIRKEMGAVRHAAAIQATVTTDVGIVFAGIGNIAELNAMTPMKSAKWQYGYWFNVEFGREPFQNRESGVWSTQENPTSTLPLAVYKKVSPAGYMSTANPGMFKAVQRQGMQPSRGIRRGLQLQLIVLDNLMNGKVSALMARHGLIERDGS